MSTKRSTLLFVIFLSAHAATAAHAQTLANLKRLSALTRVRLVQLVDALDVALDGSIMCRQ